MKAALEWFARHGVAANLLMTLIVIGGLASLDKIRSRVLPGFETNRISITVAYLGAAPEEVEQAVCARIEDRLRAVESIERVSSASAPGEKLRRG